MNPDAFADVVVMTVKAALAPVFERLAASEQCNKELQARVQELVSLRDRVITVETKAAMPAPVIPPIEPEPVDLTPILERLAAAEARLTAVGDLRDRVVMVETKAAMPMLPDASLGDLRDRMLVLETKAAVPPVTEIIREPAPLPVVPDVSDLRDRIVTLETRSAGPTTADMAIVDLRERVISLERRGQDDSLTKELGALRERVAVVEVRQPMPGPPGKDGQNGVDGLGFEDLSVDFDGDRTLALKFERGSLKKAFPIVLPFLRYQGVHQDGKTYEAGDVVTWAGSTWTASEATSTKPGEGSKAWTLCVKRGRDGRDGRDAAGALPVVSVGSR